jgi:hypothetical protein
MTENDNSVVRTNASGKLIIDEETGLPYLEHGDGLRSSIVDIFSLYKGKHIRYDIFDTEKEARRVRVAYGPNRK